MLLTLEEARELLRIDGTDNDGIVQHTLAAALGYLNTATGHDWSADATPDAVAKRAAAMLLIQWFEMPAGLAEGGAPPLTYGLTNLIKQLQYRAREEGTP